MRCEIVAEIGVNANGDVKLAKQMCDEAMDCGADVVKFQATFPRLEMSSYYLRERIEATEKVILTHAQLEEVATYCAADGYEFLCTPSEEASLHWLIHKVNPKRIKIGSDNITNIPFLEYAATYGKPIILSTGMSTMEEIDAAAEVLERYLNPEDITLLHCTSTYPCAIEDANIRAIRTMELYTDYRVGWSDHTLSVTLPACAVAMGAIMIEKHFTFDSSADGPDHKASLEPHQFAYMVKAIREVEEALGDGKKKPCDSEYKDMLTLRKGIIAKKEIQPGEVFDKFNTMIARPCRGMWPKEHAALLGTTATRKYREGEAI